MAEQQLPSAFVARMQEQLREEYEQFIEALQADRVISLRINPTKTTSQFDEQEFVPWCKEGRYLPERPTFVKDPLIFAGAYYVQEASSMFVSKVMRQVLDLERPLKVLDLCAAPGGKSTLISSLLTEDSLLISNELVSKRVVPLVENLERWGNANTIVTSNSAEDFSPLKHFFDVAVVDAPCSGEGMFRKDPKAIQLWSEHLVNMCAVRQQQILEDIAPAIKPGGYLIYSTCTFAPQENEAHMRWLLASGEFEPVDIDIEASWGITTTQVAHEGKQATGYRFYFHKSKGEGFFLTCFRKKGEDWGRTKIKSKKRVKVEFLPKKYRSIIEKWLEEPEKFDFLIDDDQVYALPKSMVTDFKFLINFLKLKKYGVQLGKFNGKKLIPSHTLAMSQLLPKGFPKLELTYGEAILYLRKQELKTATQQLSGWALAQYQGHTLGWLKVLPNRINNFYPMELRLRKEF
ncbi:MAG: methyltransferase RsmF C-terminal domain-like protein [Flammeovirgaceae bacterium]